MWHSMYGEEKQMKKYGFLALVILGGIACVHDLPSLETALFATSLVCLITGLIALVIGIWDNWGVFPEVNFEREVSKALRTPESCAEVIKGFLIFLGLVMIAVFRAQ